MFPAASVAATSNVCCAAERPEYDFGELQAASGAESRRHSRVIAPAADLSPLQWIASDEDHARREAAEVAEETADAVADVARVTGAEVGDADPVQAIEDALRQFPADEVIVVTPPGEEAGWLEKDAAVAADEQFGVPVTHLPYTSD